MLVRSFFPWDMKAAQSNDEARRLIDLGLEKMKDIDVPCDKEALSKTPSA